jgi:hypothetical protein
VGPPEQCADLRLCRSQSSGTCEVIYCRLERSQRPVATTSWMLFAARSKPARHDGTTSGTRFYYLAPAVPVVVSCVEDYVPVTRAPQNPPLRQQVRPQFEPAEHALCRIECILLDAIEPHRSGNSLPLGSQCAVAVGGREDGIPVVGVDNEGLVAGPRKVRLGGRPGLVALSSKPPGDLRRNTLVDKEPQALRREPRPGARTASMSASVRLG